MVPILPVLSWPPKFIVDVKPCKNWTHEDDHAMFKPLYLSLIAMKALGLLRHQGSREEPVLAVYGKILRTFLEMW